MSVRVLQRVLTRSDASGAERMVLAVLAFYVHDDGVLDDARLTTEVLAERAGLVRETWNRMSKTLTEAGEVAMLTQRGRYARPIYGVLSGLDGLPRLQVIQAMWRRAATRGETFAHEDQWTALARSQSRRFVTIEPLVLDAQSGQIVTIGEGFNCDRSSANSDGSSQLAPYSVFLVSRLQQQQSAPRDERARPVRLTPAQASLKQQLIGLGVYDQLADRAVTAMEPEWVRLCIHAGRRLSERGNTPGLGAVVWAMLRGEEPLPAADPAPLLAPSAPAAPDETGALSADDIRRYGVRRAGMLAVLLPEDLRRAGEYELADERERRLEPAGGEAR